MKTKTLFLILLMITLLSSCSLGTAVPAPTATSPSISTAALVPTVTSTPGAFPAPLGKKAVFTYYFYWYDSQTGEHLGPHGPAKDADPLTDEPISSPAVTWRGTDWHRKQIEDMIYAGIDVILPVYWGNPGSEWWARPGIVNLAKALDDVRDSGKTPPAVAMFYDTNAHLYQSIDLTSESGKEEVYDDIKFFFTAIPRGYWALTEDHRPMIWFYSTGALGNFDSSLLDDLSSWFVRDFGVEPYIVLDSDWLNHDIPLKYDATSAWIAAGSGSTKQITTVSPGVDDRWILEYTDHSYADRQNGNVYRNAWVKDMLCGTPWTVIETWDEYHEATDISETVQYGRTYLDLTREYSADFKNGTIPFGGLISEYKESPQVSSMIGSKIIASGLTFKVESEGEGATAPVVRNGEEARTNIEGAPYMYFDVDDGFYFNTPQPVEITIRYFDEGVGGTIYLEYDSAPCATDWDAATMYKQVPIVIQGNSLKWKTATIRVDDATFAGHQNGYYDFRIAGYETPLIISQVTITKLEN